MLKIVELIALLINAIRNRLRQKHYDDLHKNPADWYADHFNGRVRDNDDDNTKAENRPNSD